MDENIYLKGEKLLGDDFTIDEIKAWYKDEKEGYANLGAKNKTKYQYSWHGINKIHGFRYLGSSPILMENGVKWVAWRSSKHHPSLPYYLLCKA